MAKVITVRLTDDEYKKISETARLERRPISNFIVALVLREIEESYYADPIEMAQIRSDKSLLERLQAGHSDARRKRGRLVG